MTCAEFLDRFSEYYDGLVSPEAAARFDDHRQACTSCRRYAQVLETSLGLLQELPEVDPAEDMTARVHYRIQVEDENELVGFGPLGSATATRTIAFVTLVLAFTAWAPSMARRVATDTVGPMVLPVSAADRQSDANSAANDPTVGQIELAPFAAGQLSAPDDDVKQLWSYPNAMLYEHSPLSGRSRWQGETDGFIRAVGLE